MPALTPEFLFDFESNMRSITENEYARLSQEMVWSKFARTMPSSSSKEIVAWLLSTAQIEDLEQQGGKMFFEDLASKYVTYENRFAGSGLKLQRRQIEDLDGGGMDLAGKWSSDIGAQMSYWPQKQFFRLLKAGEAATYGLAYDGEPFFDTAHLVHPLDPAKGTYANLLTGSASGSYPGALPIHGSDVSVALDNLSKAVAYVRSIKMPNGEDPKMLRAASILAPPALAQRLAQLTNATFIAQAVGSAGGAADVEALVKSLGLVEVVIADELAGDDTTWYLATRELGTTQLGSMVYIDREPFKITYYTGQGGGTGVDAFLDRADELEWHCKGRNGIGYGHPYGMFKIKGT